MRLAADEVGGHAAKGYGHVVEGRDPIVGKRDAVNQQADLMTGDQSFGGREAVLQSKNQGIGISALVFFAAVRQIFVRRAVAEDFSPIEAFNQLLHCFRRHSGGVEAALA